MSILNFENRTPRTLQGMYDYLVDINKTDNLGVFGLGVNPKYAVMEMDFVQKVYFQEQLSHPYVQVIFSFDVGVALDILALRKICIEIGNCLVTDERQVLGAIHYKDTDKKHCHYMINYVGMRGNLYRQGHSVIFFKERTNRVLERYGLSPVIYFGFEAKALTG